MDPTKPILNLYADSNTNSSYRPSRSTYQQPRYQPPHNNYKPYPKNQAKKSSSKSNTGDISYSQLKNKYQQLYQSYNQKVSRLNDYQQEFMGCRQENEQLRHELDEQKHRNDQLHASLISKNQELTQSYQKLQNGDFRRGSARKQEVTIDRLENGLKEAIESNLDLLRDAVISELRDNIS